MGTINISKKYTAKQKSYLPAIMIGMKITLKRFIQGFFFRKHDTIMYPEQKREYSPVYRGQHVLMRDEEGRERCTACGLCALSCPAEAITMKAAERTKDEMHLYREEKYAAIYEINMLRCIFCGLCEEACPKDAIYLTKSQKHVKPDVTRQSFIYGKDKLVISVEDGKSGKYAGLKPILK